MGKERAIKFFSELFRRLILLGLIGYFVTKTSTSILKLLNKEVGTLFKSKFSNQMLFPSTTVCKVSKNDWEGETFPVIHNISSVLLQIRYWQQLDNRLAILVICEYQQLCLLITQIISEQLRDFMILRAKLIITGLTKEYIYLECLYPHTAKIRPVSLLIHKSLIWWVSTERQGRHILVLSMTTPYKNTPFFFIMVRTLITASI
jgi:hypothetical protein